MTVDLTCTLSMQITEHQWWLSQDRLLPACEHWLIPGLRLQDMAKEAAKSVEDATKGLQQGTKGLQQSTQGLQLSPQGLQQGAKGLQQSAAKTAGSAPAAAAAAASAPTLSVAHLLWCPFGAVLSTCSISRACTVAA